MNNLLLQIDQIKSEARLNLIAAIAKKGRKKSLNFTTAIHEVAQKEDCELNVIQHVENVSELIGFQPYELDSRFAISE